jgi:hypothetical protein
VIVTGGLDHELPASTGLELLGSYTRQQLHTRLGLDLDGFGLHSFCLLFLSGSSSVRIGLYSLSLCVIQFVIVLSESGSTSSNLNSENFEPESKSKSPKRWRRNIW